MAMSILEKTRILGEAGKWDICASSASSRIINAKNNQIFSGNFSDNSSNSSLNSSSNSSQNNSSNGGGGTTTVIKEKTVEKTAPAAPAKPEKKSESEDAPW